MPWESTPRRLAEIRQAAVTSALCRGTPAPCKIASQNCVSSVTGMVGMNFQGNATPGGRAWRVYARGRVSRQKPVMAVLDCWRLRHKGVLNYGAISHNTNSLARLAGCATIRRGRE